MTETSYCVFSILTEAANRISISMRIRMTRYSRTFTSPCDIIPLASQLRRAKALI